jgi:TolA-binding protein
MKRRLLKRAASVLLLLSVSAPVPARALDEAERLWLVGERASADGLHALARRTLERFVTEFPNDSRVPQAILLVGRARLALGETEPALQAFRRARTYQPPPGRPQEARFWEAEALFRLKRFAEARTAYEEVLRADSTSPLAPEAQYGLAWCELETKRPEAAAKAWRDLASTWPDHTLASSATYYQARALVELKRPSDALPLLKGYAAKYPNAKLLPDARYLLGWVRVSTGDVKGGLGDLRGFVAAFPNHEEVPAARRLIAEAAARSNDREDQQEALRALLAQDPATAQSLADAAALAGRLGRTGDQETALRKLRTQFPQHPMARRAALDQATAAFQRKDWKDASTLAQAAAQSEDDTVKAEAWLLTGESELKLKRYPTAAKAFEAVGAVKTVEPSVRYRALAGLGLAREEQQDFKAALTAYEAVAARGPDDTLREWARDRAASVKARMTKAPAPAPSDKAPAQSAPGDKKPAPGAGTKPKG